LVHSKIKIVFALHNFYFLPMKRIFPPVLFAALLLVFPAACSHTRPVSPTAPALAENINRAVPNTATNPVPRDPGWIKRHDRFVQEAQKGGIDILFLGDSITDYWRSRGSNVWSRYYAPRHAADFGISADRTQHVLWRLEHG
jgi:hypothetical protein